MDVTLEINVTQDEQKQLRTILKCTQDELSVRLQKYCTAASEEYIRMCLGQRVFTRGSDIREYRLFLLIRHAFGNRLPDEQTVCDIFQCTMNQSRSLLRSVMSKYQYELKKAVDQTLIEVIKTAKQDQELEEGVVITVNSENVIEALNRELATIDGSLPQISKKRGSVITYHIKPSSYEALCKHFSIQE